MFFAVINLIVIFSDLTPLRLSFEQAKIIIIYNVQKALENLYMSKDKTRLYFGMDTLCTIITWNSVSL